MKEWKEQAMMMSLFWSKPACLGLWGGSLYYIDARQNYFKRQRKAEAQGEKAGIFDQREQLLTYVDEDGCL